MRTVVQNLNEMAEGAKELVRDLLTRYASIHSERGDLSCWETLSAEGQQVQARALGVYNRYAAVVNALLRGHPEDAGLKLREYDEDIRGAIEQTAYPGRSVERVLGRVLEAFDA